MRASSELLTKRNANGVEVKAKVIKEKGNTAGAEAGAEAIVEVAVAATATATAEADDTDILDIADITTEVFF